MAHLFSNRNEITIARIKQNPLHLTMREMMHDEQNHNNDIKCDEIFNTLERSLEVQKSFRNSYEDLHSTNHN